jgi:hypothetical protein
MKTKGRRNESYEDVHSNIRFAESRAVLLWTGWQNYTSRIVTAIVPSVY